MMQKTKKGGRETDCSGADGGTRVGLDRGKGEQSRGQAPNSGAQGRVLKKKGAEPGSRTGEGIKGKPAGGAANEKRKTFKTI